MFMKAAKILAAATAAIALVLAAAVLGRAFAAVPETANPAVTTTSPAAQAGTFTGEYVNGVPVYRLPAVSVTVSRAVALARIEQEEKLAAAERAALVGAPAAQQPIGALQTAPVSPVPDRNVALMVGLVLFGTILSIVLSFGLFTGAKRRRAARLVTPATPRTWLPAQPSMPTTAPAVQGEAVPAPRVPEPVSLTALRAQEQRERRREARRRAAAAQVDAASA